MRHISARRAAAAPTRAPAWLLALALAAPGAGHADAAPEDGWRHALALHGEPRYGPGFSHFDYADPDAPKGGEARLAQIGTFDSLNPFILKGVAAAGVQSLFETLTYNSDDEAFSEYGLLAEHVRVAEDGSWVEFRLRPEARFHDGHPVDVGDVVWTFESLKREGHPFYQSYYRSVERAEQTGPRTVRFVFSVSDNRELPLIMGQMPVLPEHWWEGREFDATTLDPPLGSGPYRVGSVEPGRSVTLRRVEDYWGRDLPVNAGRDNFDTIRYDYYRDTTVALEAFKSGEYDLRLENVSKLWANGYEGPALEQGLIKKEKIPHEIPTGMQAFVYNTRRPVFSDPRVRAALAYAFDFEWTNKTLFNDAYTRTTSYFSNSELASRGLPGPGEVALLEPFRDRLPPEVFEREYEPPSTDGSGNIRRNLREGLALLREAGWEVRDNRLVSAESGEPFEFELMLLAGSTFERIALPFQRNLERLGVTMRVRPVDSAQYQKRLDDFDFGMVVLTLPQSLSPGNEQRNYWTSAAATTPGSRNYAGVRDPVVDALVEKVISAPDRERLIERTRALDRVLLWGHYVIPQWHIRSFRVAYWDRFGRPEQSPKYAFGFDTWWLDADKAAAIDAHRGTQ